MSTPEALVIGCGSIGQRHIRNLRALGVERITAFDPDPSRLQAVRELGARPVDSMEDALAERPVAVLICTPPHLHVEHARAALQSGAHGFVEKPISHSLEGVDALVRLARDQQRVLMVGYNLRFEPGLQKVKSLLDEGAIGRLLMVQAEFGQYLPDWRPAQDYRAGYNVSAQMGGGIILDASHEIDYVRWLAGEVERVFCVAGKLGNLEMNVEDAAALTLECANGVIAEVHLDSLQRAYSRRCKLIGTDGVVTWDLRAGVRYAGTDRTWKDVAPASDPNEMYLEEMRSFLDALGSEKARVQSGIDEGVRVLQIALAARSSADIRQPVTLGSHEPTRSSRTT